MDDTISALTPKGKGVLLTIDGVPVVEEAYMFERGVYFYEFYCLGYVKVISTDILEKQVLEERDPDLNGEEDTRMEDSREEHWRDIADDGKDKSKIYYLRWYVYTKRRGS